MGIFRNYQKEEELRIAKEVIESDRRTKSQFDLRMKNFKLERIIATLIAGAIAYVVFFMILPAQRAKQEKQQTETQIQTEQ